MVVFSCQITSVQGFVNLGFENTTITPILVNSFSGFYDYIATAPGWTWTPQNNAPGVNVNSMVSLNDIALDAPAVTLQGTDSPYEPAISGKYSIFLQGGSFAVSPTSYAAIWQAGQIPSTAESMTYWGGPLQATFNGQALSFVALSDTPNYTIWGADISAFAGQSGQLQFTAPWQTAAFLDNIQFSSSPIPEPTALSLLIAAAAVHLMCRRWFGFLRRW